MKADKMWVDEYERYQDTFRARQFCIGWHPVDSQKRTYYDALWGSWHEANEIAKGLQQDSPTLVVFVEAVIITQNCPSCEGSGFTSEIETHGVCNRCHGKGKIRKR